MGRHSEYSQAMADKICELIATTPRGLDFICRTNEDLPCAKTVHTWLSKNDYFLQKYLRARESQADLIFDECLEIADNNAHDTIKADGGREVLNGEWVARCKLRVDTRMRMAGKLAPKKYGDKIEHEHGGKNGAPIRVLNIIESAHGHETPPEAV